MYSLEEDIRSHGQVLNTDNELPSVSTDFSRSPGGLEMVVELTPGET